MTESIIETHTTTWRGIAIEIRFEPRFMNLTAIHLSWIGITSETGFASKYLPPSMFEEHDGPVASRSAGSISPRWEAPRQLSLF